jgi:hypothetical protein
LFTFSPVWAYYILAALTFVACRVLWMFFLKMPLYTNCHGRRAFRARWTNPRNKSTHVRNLPYRMNSRQAVLCIRRFSACLWPDRCSRNREFLCCGQQNSRLIVANISMNFVQKPPRRTPKLGCPHGSISVVMAACRRERIHNMLNLINTHRVPYSCVARRRKASNFSRTMRFC